MMNAILLAVVWLIETTVKFAIGGMLFVLVVFAIINASRWLMNNSSTGRNLKRT